MTLDPSQVRVWHDGWWRQDAGAWVQVATPLGPGQWGTCSADLGAGLRELVVEALALSSGEPIAIETGSLVRAAGAVVLVTEEWGASCVRLLVGDSGAQALVRLPPPPLVVVLRPHPPNKGGIRRSIEYVSDAIRRGRNNPRLVTWVRQRLHENGLDGPRGNPSPDQIVGVIFQAQKKEVSFVKDPVNGELMARPEHLLCLDPSGPCMPAGDCDDQLILAGSAIASVGIPLRLVIRTYPNQKYGHITLEYDSAPRLGGPWKCLDPSTDAGTCSPIPYVEQTIVDPIAQSDQTFVGLGDPVSAGALGQPPAGATDLPDDQAAGWIAQIERTIGTLSSASSRLRSYSTALRAVRVDLGLPAVDPPSSNEAQQGSSPLESYVQTGQWTQAAQDAESKLLQTSDFVSGCLQDALNGSRDMYFANGDILISQKPGDPYAIRLAPTPGGGQVLTYFDAQGNSTGTLGLAPIIIGAIAAAITLGVAYVVGKICDQLATTHHDDALTKIANEQTQLVQSGAQTPEQARGMVQALNDLDKAAPPPPSALQKVLDAFPVVTVLGAVAAGIAGGFGLSRLVGSLSLPFSSKGSAHAPRRRSPIHVERERLDRGGYTRSGRYFGIGEPLYYVWSEDSDRTTYIRAVDRRDAIEKARAFFEGRRLSARRLAG